MSKPFDQTKPIQTRSGYAARIICTDRKHKQPILALVKRDCVGDGETVEAFNSDGGYAYEKGFRSPEDLINIPEEPKWRAWRPDEVPVGALIRYKPEPNGRAVILFAYGNTIYDSTPNGLPLSMSQYSCEDALIRYEHSIDPIGTPDAKRTWSKCGILEA